MKFTRIQAGHYHATTPDYFLTIQQVEKGWNLEVRNIISGALLEKFWAEQKSKLVDIATKVIVDMDEKVFSRHESKPVGGTTVLPKNPIKEFEDWMEYIGSSVDESPEDKFEREFTRIWTDFKASIIRARTR